MINPSITLFSEQIDFKYPNKENLTSWIVSCAQKEGRQLEALNIIFCNDEYLLEINRKYLDHDNYTDIITFDNSERGGGIDAELFVSIQRVKENALGLEVPFTTELDRVIIHGLLHLMDYSDKTSSDQKIMREKEDAYLLLRSK